MTLGPLVAGVVLFALHLAGIATRRLGIALAVIAAALPAFCVALLVPAIAPGDPVMVRPFGAGSGFTAWIAPAFRIDTLAIYVGLGCAVLVVPLLLWLSFAQRSGPNEPVVEDTSTGTAAPAATASADEDDITSPVHARSGDWRSIIGVADQLSPTAVRSLAFTCLLSTALVSAIFADSLVMAGVAWLVVVLAGWAIGEASSDRAHLDRLGLGFSLIGPLMWVVVVIVAVHNVGATRFVQLMGVQPFNVAESVILAVALALAGGAYPATAWIRRRAAFASPAGIGALVLGILPLAVYLGARTYAVAADGAARWPILIPSNSNTNAPPPITAGIAFCALGAFTIAMAGLLALGRRDARTLIALLASAQVGWAMVALGAGTTISGLAVVMLLSTSVLGLGAMMASVVAGGAITTDIEPDADGPRPVGAPVRPATLAAWSIGAATLVGVPLFAGFVGRQLTSAGMLSAGGLNVPLGALCWAGDALLALALLRATAPALGEQFEAADDEQSKPQAPRIHASELPAIVFAVIAVLVAILPGYALGLYGGVAARSLLAPGAIAALLRSDALGYTAGATQWLSGIIWLAAVLLAAIVLALQPTGSSRLLLPAIGAKRTDEVDDTEDATTLAEPADSWNDLGGAFTSGWTVPGRQWLLDGIDDGAYETDESNETEDGADASKDRAVSIAARTEEVKRDDG